MRPKQSNISRTLMNLDTRVAATRYILLLVLASSHDQLGEINYEKNLGQAEKYFDNAICSFLEKVDEKKENYFGDTDFELMLNDFRNGVIKFNLFYELVCRHLNNVYCVELKNFADSRRAKLT